jgi:hypothetical protein
MKDQNRKKYNPNRDKRQNRSDGKGIFAGLDDESFSKLKAIVTEYRKEKAEKREKKKQKWQNNKNKKNNKKVKFIPRSDKPGKAK